MKASSTNPLVRYSRAGDVFHYRWAARRCLRLINPKSNLKSVIVEGSKENRKAGEYVIDLTEYSELGLLKKTEYFQLKHSSVRKHKAIAFHELKATLAGFAKRFRAIAATKGRKENNKSCAFTIVTNRFVSTSVKNSLQAISEGRRVKMQQILERATHLKGADLRTFCKAVSLIDGEGDYIVQRETLRGEIDEYIAGFVREGEIERLIALITERALPNSDGLISPEDVLERLGVSSTRGLFPAPPEFEDLPNVVRREQHDELLKQILNASTPIVIHATGGVGKSVFARQILDSLPSGSKGFIYDCFGGGKYRNTSEPRHRARDALVEIANEMASLGICQPLIVGAGTLPDEIFRAFLRRVEQAATSLRAIKPNALLILLFDAADNAELAAQEAGDPCFASALLRERFPEACRLVMFSRTERVESLRPPHAVRQFLLEPFTKSETAAHLRIAFPKASERDALEFHRLSGGNPRVQANALTGNDTTLGEVLTRLGPLGTTVEKQIEAQLDFAIGKLKDNYPQTIQPQIDSICRGLANLPPFVPIEVLACAAGVKEAAILSFVSDLGRPLWCSDNAVQFRDEPTESWFRRCYSAEPATVKTYAIAIEALAGKYTYVARVLPQLLLIAGDYDRLINLALSDGCLPENNPIDERDIRVFRLQFAFKAALKMERRADAARLALRAGEEVAGDRRQLELLRSNIDLIAPLQDSHRVQELVYRQTFVSSWIGSENVYGASLLSSVPDFHGEARSYLRSALRWLQIHLDKQKKAPNTVQCEPTFPPEPREELTDTDMVEFAWTVFNLQGAAGVLRFITQWDPPHFVFRLARSFARRLIDAGRFDELDEFAILSAKHLFVILAVVDELLAVGKIPRKEIIRHSVASLSSKNKPIAKARSTLDSNHYTPSIISLTEAAAYRGLSIRCVKSLLQAYTFPTGDPVLNDNFQEENRRTFLRGVAMRSVLSGSPSADIAALVSKRDTKGESVATQSQAEKDFAETIGILLPWYLLRARMLCRDQGAGTSEARILRSQTEECLERRYRTHDRLPYEVTRLQFEVLALNERSNSNDVRDFVQNSVNAKENKFILHERLEALRVAYRLEHLRELRSDLEQSCVAVVAEPSGSTPEERAGWFISMARAVFPVSREDAAAYFSDAIESVSKFGDEIVDRWGAVVALAERAAEAKTRIPELAYRFIRCAETVGETTSEDYWDRNQSIRVAARLDTPGTFAALSRWRDRAVGWFNNQLRTLATEAVKRGFVPASAAWSLSGFELCNGSVEFAAACIEEERNKVLQQRIFNRAVRDLQLSGGKPECWIALEGTADRYSLKKDTLAKARLNLAHSEDEEKAQDSSDPSSLLDREKEKSSWSGVFGTVDLLSVEGLDAAKDIFRNSGPFAGLQVFWRELIEHVPVGKETQFLRVLLDAPSLEIYDISNAVEEINHKWLQRPAVKRDWPTFLMMLGKRFAEQIVTEEYWNRFFGQIAGQHGGESLQKGVFEGLAGSLDLIDASTFFGFVRNVSGRLTSTDAEAVLDFALSRLEKHIPEDFGDGPWANWLNTAATTADVLAGFMWAALGSPYSGVRWQAAHAARRLAENDCEAEIGSLVSFLTTRDPGPFVSPRLPFYHFHAQLYLLIALARAALDYPHLLKAHASVFANIALEGLPHVLIQSKAAEIALSLSRAYPRLFSKPVQNRLKRVGLSPFSIKKPKSIPPRSTTGKGRSDLRYHFALDFDRYWFEPLANVFGVPNEKIMASAAQVVAREINVQIGQGYVADPRQQQWNNLDQRGSTGTYAHKGEYARIDRFDFYYSYHACMVVASELLSKTPVLRRYSYDEEDPWNYWLKWHLLSRRDGKWLADRRDPSPPKRPDWVKQKTQEDWLWRLKADDFLNCLRDQSPLPNSIFVSGHWCECKESLVENVSISSALVNPATANALATALRTADDPDGFRLPDYLDQRAEIHHSPFELLGWIHETRGHHGIDRFDPYSKEIVYPPDVVAPSFASMLGLFPDEEFRTWRARGATQPSLICEVWSEKTNNPHEEPFRHGQRNAASCKLLRKLCALTGKELIIEVRIRRSRHRDRYSREDDLGHIPASHKIFTFSSHGVLKDRDKSYQLG